jgi:mannose-6-phosphate isomerase-like protein (cupin superfamily)
MRGMRAVRHVIRFEDVPWRRNDDPRDELNFRRLIWQETGSNELCVGIGELSPGCRLGLHHHEEDAEFYYVLAGRAKVTVDDEEIDATPGTAIYMPSKAKHKIENESGEKFVFVYGLNAATRRYVWDEPLEK